MLSQGTFPVPSRFIKNDDHHIEMIGIASSTGGPYLLAEIFREIPASFTIPIVVVQTIKNGFTPTLRDWLSQQTKLGVCIAAHQTEPRSGFVTLAPEGLPLRFNQQRQLESVIEAGNQDRKTEHHFLFQSMAEIYGQGALGISLDNNEEAVEGLEAIHRAGGLAVIQDQLLSGGTAGTPVGMAYSSIDYILNPSQITIMLLLFEHIKRKNYQEQGLGFRIPQTKTANQGG